jgi:hypothetical protein
MNERLSTNGLIGASRLGTNSTSTRNGGARRVHDYTIARVELLKRRLLSMVQLDEATLDASEDVLSRHHSDPEVVGMAAGAPGATLPPL